MLLYLSDPYVQGKQLAIGPTDHYGIKNSEYHIHRSLEVGYNSGTSPLTSMPAASVKGFVFIQHPEYARAGKFCKEVLQANLAREVLSFNLESWWRRILPEHLCGHDSSII